METESPVGSTLPPPPNPNPSVVKGARGAGATRTFHDPAISRQLVIYRHRVKGVGLGQVSDWGKMAAKGTGRNQGGMIGALVQETKIPHGGKENKGDFYRAEVVSRPGLALYRVVLTTHGASYWLLWEFALSSRAPSSCSVSLSVTASPPSPLSWTPRLWSPLQGTLLTSSA